jgi:glutamine amidotransferase
MSRPTVTIVDYGMGNMLNVVRAFEYCGAEVAVIEEANSVFAADRLVVPGVGAFSNSMRALNISGFGEAICAFAGTSRPLFGICVGMQMLFDASEEFGEHSGLSLLPGRVKAISVTRQDGGPQRVPHIGWNHLVEPVGGRDWLGSLLEPVAGSQPPVYFVHSFAAVPDRESDRLADCFYGGHRICAAVQRGNLMATQFHPERSGEVGLAMVRRFLHL